MPELIAAVSTPTQHDKRYQINLEFCGYITRHHVLRFCGQFISSHVHMGDAISAREQHAAERHNKLPERVQKTVIWHYEVTPCPN